MFSHFLLSLLIAITPLAPIAHADETEGPWFETVRARYTLSAADLELVKKSEWFELFGQDLSIGQLEHNWEKYRRGIEQKVIINAKNLERMEAPQVLTDALTTLLQLENFIAVLADLNRFSAIRTQFTNATFRWVMQQPDALNYLAETPKEDFMDFVARNVDIRQVSRSADFQNAFRRLRTELANAQVFAAVQSYVRAGLSLIEERDRQDALQLIKQYKAAGLTIEKLARPLKMTDLPYPMSKGSWSRKAKAMSREAIAYWLFNNPTGSPAYDIYNDVPVISGNVFDVIIEPAFHGRRYTLAHRTVSDIELAAIDHVARTLYGEARGCVFDRQERVIEPQFHIVGRVIADRSRAILQRLNSERQAFQNNMDLFEKVKDSLMRRERYQALMSPRGNGLRDFGRLERTNMPAAAQVTSRYEQYSVWNSYLKNEKPLLQIRGSALPKNIPNFNIVFKVGRNADDQAALNNALKPSSRNPKLWLTSVQVATQVVLNMDDFIRKNQWIGAERIYFYTHQNINFSWAKEVTTTVQGFNSDGVNYPKASFAGGNTKCAMRYFIARDDDYGLR